MLTLEVADNGVGFVAKDLADATGLGLAGMRERAQLLGRAGDLVPEHARSALARRQQAEEVREIADGLDANVVVLGRAIQQNPQEESLEVQRDRVITWLRGIETGEPAPNNWQFFRLLVQAGLERVGAPVDVDARRRSVEMIDSFHQGDGWYTDGDGGNVDFYRTLGFEVLREIVIEAIDLPFTLLVHGGGM